MTKENENSEIVKPLSKKGQDFKDLQAEAILYSKSDFAKPGFKGSIPNCYVVLQLAQEMGIPKGVLFRNMSMIHGNPSFSASFVIAGINKSGKFSTLRYEYSGEGDDYGCAACATDLKSGELIKGTKVTMRMAKSEGWVKSNKAKWENLTDQMLMYRAAAFFERAYSPESSQGFLTTEEVLDMGSSETDGIKKKGPDLGGEEVPIDSPKKEPGDEKKEDETTPPAAKEEVKRPNYEAVLDKLVDEEITPDQLIAWCKDKPLDLEDETECAKILEHWSWSTESMKRF